MSIASRGATTAVDWEQRIDFVVFGASGWNGAGVATGLHARRSAPL